MNFLKVIVKSSAKVPLFVNQPYRTNTFSSKRSRQPSLCDVCLPHPDKRPCFDMDKVYITKGNLGHAKMIKSFLNTHYWPREPSVCGLWIDLESPYLELLTDKYSLSGDRFLAFERQDRTGECKLIGVAVANRVYPWIIGELEDWAHYTYCKPDRNRIYFTAHCYKSPGLWKKHKVEYIYDVEILGTSAEVTGQGVGTLLLKTVLDHARECGHHLAHIVSLSRYTEKICAKNGMKSEWSMDYTEFVDHMGQSVFYPRRPHSTVTVYTKYFDPFVGGELPCKPQH